MRTARHADASDPSSLDVGSAFKRRFDALAAIGRDPVSGATDRFSWTVADLEARAWFIAEATDLDLRVESDGFGNLWAWWPDLTGDAAIATGSHLDTVPGGGSYDGALGVVSALGAIERLRHAGLEPVHPIGVVVFTEEEGARFGMATLGSRLASGQLDPTVAMELRDASGTSLADAMRAARAQPDPVGVATGQVARLAAFVELHIEQGRHLVDVPAPIAVGSGIVPHGRWRLTVTGEGNHAGTTRLADRHDPALPLADAITSARRQAARHEAVATIGRIELAPNGTNVIAAQTRAWLDARAPDDGTLSALVADWSADVRRAAVAHGCEVAVVEESRSASVQFDTTLTQRIRETLSRHGRTVPVIPTAAGHDAGVLAGSVSTAMLFVRNPTGISHAAAEAATVDDCVSGVEALATVLADLAS